MLSEETFKKRLERKMPASLRDQVAHMWNGCPLSRQDSTPQNGKKLEMILNPQFTEWMMGLPTGWTELEVAEIPLCHWQAHMRGLLLKIHCKNLEYETENNNQLILI